MDALSQGFGTPFVKITFNGEKEEREIMDRIDSFSYTHGEKEKYCEFTIKSDTEFDLPDRVEFQENQELKIQWGYLEGPKSQIRKVYIRDIMVGYGDNGITFTVKATDKFSLLSDDKGKRIFKNVDINALTKDILADKDLVFDGVAIEGERLVIDVTKIRGEKQKAVINKEQVETEKDELINPELHKFRIYKNL